MRRLTPFLVLILSLAFASDAVAKRVVSAKVCGPSECRETHDRSDLAAFEEGGPPTSPPKAKSGWYTVRVRIAVEGERHQSFPLVVVPRAHLIRGEDGEGGYSWAQISPSAVKVYERLTRGIDSFAAAKLAGTGPPKVRVDEVVLPPREPETSGGGASPLPWIAAGLALLAVAAGLVRRRRGRGFPWARPSEG
jgi:MYXO-CTERM domain-containing protein